MPNRIIKESICTSETLSGLNWFEEVLFYRLIVNCDDFGRFYADSRIINGKLFPLKEVTDKQIAAALVKLSEKDLLQIYEIDKRKYLELCTWTKHQKVRAKKSKFPAPADNCGQLNSIENNCEQLPANVPVFVFDNDNVFDIDKTDTSANKNIFGEFKNVLLTGDEHGKLVDSLGDRGAVEYIERLSAYLAQSGRTYENHYATMLSWWRKDGKPVSRSAPAAGPLEPDKAREVEQMSAREVFGGDY